MLELSSVGRKAAFSRLLLAFSRPDVLTAWRFCWFLVAAVTVMGGVSSIRHLSVLRTNNEATLAAISLSIYNDANQLGVMVRRQSCSF